MSDDDAPIEGAPPEPPSRIPHDMAAEQSVLGAMLLSPLGQQDAAAVLRPEDFYAPLHAQAFTAMLDMIDHGERIDVVTVYDRLVAAEANVDRRTVAGWQARVPGSAGAASYARIVAAHASRRRLIAASLDIGQAARDLSVDLPDVIALARTMVERADLPLGGAPDPDLDAIVDTPHEHDWLVPGLMERGDRCLLVAEEGAGKSMMLRQVAVQCSQGIHPWWLYEVRPIRVLVVDLENNPRLSARKFDKMRDAARLVRGDRYDPARLRVVLRPEGIDVTQRADAMWLTERVAANRPDLVCLGPLYKLHEADESSAVDVRQVQKVLDRIRSRYGCALWMETHAPHESFTKGGTIRPAGSRLWHRWPEFIKTLQPQNPRERGTPWLMGHGRAPRDEREWPTTWRRGGGRWDWSTLDAPPRLDAPHDDLGEPF